MELIELAQALERGCPPDKALGMARQLDRRARMDADRQGIAYEAALQRLVGLMAQGWARRANESRMGVGWHISC